MHLQILGMPCKNKCKIESIAQFFASDGVLSPHFHDIGQNQKVPGAFPAPKWSFTLF